MFKPDDISSIEARGINPEAIHRQLSNFRKGFPYLQITAPAALNRGLKLLSPEQVHDNILLYHEKIACSISVQKFVPASGAASRMFKSLFSALDALKKNSQLTEILKETEVNTFYTQLDKFAFYNDLTAMIANQNFPSETAQLQNMLELLLLERGLNYAGLPKGLLKFHGYPEEIRTALEEHLVEGALYAQNKDQQVNIHFTVSPEHQSAFEKKISEVISKYEEKFQVKFVIGFSQQKSSTDTIAVTPDNEPFRNSDGSLLFRPAGHGALIENLNELDSDIIFIKNIDNVVPDELKSYTVDFKKALAGALLSLQENIFNYQQILATTEPESLESGFYAEAVNFIENILNITLPEAQKNSDKTELHHYLKQKFNRPIRVCGMVKNQGEPGGGPFFAKNSDGSISLQIVESSQIDFSDQIQSALASKASHFNPVDLVCAIKDYTGKKYDLSKFVDHSTGFISAKSQNGKELKAMELPGLWNGAMSDWNTIFIEVPIETFNPVKTVTDLLRNEHQVKK